MNEKTNEIKAIPELLDILCLKGCVVTIDAMGTQKDIAEKIIEKEANYILQVKGNRKSLWKILPCILKKICFHVRKVNLRKKAGMTWIISIEYLEDYTQGLNNRVKIDIVCKLFIKL